MVGVAVYVELAPVQLGLVPDVMAADTVGIVGEIRLMVMLLLVAVAVLTHCASDVKIQVITSPSEGLTGV